MKMLTVVFSQLWYSCTSLAYVHTCKSWPYSLGGSIKAPAPDKLSSVKAIFPAWFDQLEESFLIKRSRQRSFSCQWKNNFLPDGQTELPKWSSQLFNLHRVWLLMKLLVKGHFTSGLEKYLNSTLPIGQVTLKFCLPGSLPRLPKFSNSLIIQEPKNGGQSTGRLVLNFM